MDKQQCLEFENKYRKTHKIERVYDLECDLEKLNPDQSVAFGDGKTYYYLLTKLTPNKAE